MKLLLPLLALTLGPAPALAAAKESALATIKPYSVTLSVQNLEEVAAWYKEKLGFKEVKAKEYPEFGTALKFLELNGYRVEIIKDGSAGPGLVRPDPPKHTGTFGVSQFAFETKRLDALEKELAERNVNVVWKFENADLGAKFLFVRDPAGNLIQFLQRL